MITENRRTFWDDAQAFQICLRPGVALSDAKAAVRRAAKASGLTNEGGRLKGATKARPGIRQYNYRRTGALRSFGVSFASDPSSSSILLFPAVDAATDEPEADAVSEFAVHICVQSRAILGRSFSFAASNAAISPDEITGPIRWIDWLQYYSEEVVNRIGRHRLETLAVFRVTSCDDGALFVRATRMPDEHFARRPLAEHMGIALRPFREWHPEIQTWSEREWPW
jgi:hypothetical protein